MVGGTAARLFGFARSVQGAVKDRSASSASARPTTGKRGEFFGENPVDQIRVALDQALAESGLDRREIDGFATYSVDS